MIDFTRASQDNLAFETLRSRGALNAVCAADLATAYNLLRNEWISLPGVKPSRMTIAVGRNAFISFGGTAK